MSLIRFVCGYTVSQPWLPNLPFLVEPRLEASSLAEQPSSVTLRLSYGIQSAHEYGHHLRLLDVVGLAGRKTPVRARA